MSEIRDQYAWIASAVIKGKKIQQVLRVIDDENGEVAHLLSSNFEGLISPAMRELVLNHKKNNPTFEIVLVKFSNTEIIESI